MGKSDKKKTASPNSYFFNNVTSESKILLRCTHFDSVELDLWTPFILAEPHNWVNHYDIFFYF